MTTYIGVDTGGTSTRIWDGTRSLPLVSTPADYSLYVDLIGRSIDTLVEGPVRLAIAIPGVVRNNRLIAAANLDATWLDRDIARDIRAGNAQVESVTALQDTEAAGYAARAHDARGSESSLLLTISTGLGGAWITPDFVRPLEIGHTPLDLSGEGNMCGCSQIGCVEADLSGTAIRKRTGLAAAQLDDSEFWRRFGNEFGRFLTMVVPLFAVDTVVLMGGVSNLSHLFLDVARERLGNELRHLPMPDLRVSQLGNDIGAIGAYQYALERSL